MLKRFRFGSQDSITNPNPNIIRLAKITNPNPNIRDSEEKIRIRIRIRIFVTTLLFIRITQSSFAEGARLGAGSGAKSRIYIDTTSLHLILEM